MSERARERKDRDREERDGAERGHIHMSSGDETASLSLFLELGLLE